MNQANLPQVTFLSPCFNHEKYVIESLESIRKQTYSNIHHHIIDDASSDKSAYLIEKWIDVNQYPCTFIRHPHNKGISYTLNESIAMTKSQYWTACATDDFVAEHHTEKFVQYFECHPEIVMVAADMSLVNEFSEQVKVKDNFSFLYNCVVTHPRFNAKNFGSYESLLFGNYIPGCLMIRKKVFDEIGNFSEKFKVEDWDMWLRIAAKHTIGFLDEYLGSYRRHGQNTISNNEAVMKNLVQIFLSQKATCYKSGNQELFNNAYYHHFDSMFSRGVYTSQSFGLLTFGTTSLFFTALLKKIQRLINKRIG